MLVISTSKFCSIFGINHHSFNPSLFTLIDSLSEVESEYVHGKLIAKLGRLRKQYSTAKDSIYGYISFIQNCFIKFESDIFLLTFHYSGVNWNGSKIDNWWWTDQHDNILKNLINKELFFDKKNVQFLEFTAHSPDLNYKNTIQQLLNKCADKIIYDRDIELGTDALNFLFMLNKLQNQDDFLNSILIKLISINNNSKVEVNLHAITKVKKLLYSISNNSNESIQQALLELNLEYPPHVKNIEFYTPISSKRHEWIDPNWWREQE